MTTKSPIHAYLVTGSNPQARLDHVQNHIRELEIHTIDVVTCVTEAEHIGIGDIRAFTRRLMFAPNQSPYTAGLIHDAHTMTIEAQNALLKTLEEPPPHAVIFLSTPSQDDMLPTIVSRCVTVSLKTTDTKADTEKISAFVLTFIEASVGSRLTLLEPFTKDRITAKLWLESIIPEIRQSMLTHIRKNAKNADTEARLLTMLLEAYADIQANINPKLAIETRLISI